MKGKFFALTIILLSFSLAHADRLSEYDLALDPAGEDYLLGVDTSDLTMAPTGTNKRYRLRDLPVSDPVAAALGLKQDAVAAAVDQEIIDGIETDPRLMSPAQIKLSAQTHGSADAGDITGVLGDATGEVPFLYQAWAAFSAGDATPDVSSAQHFRTVDTTTITGFDHGAGAITDGRTLTVYCGAATVFDLTSSEITAANRSTDYTASTGTVLTFVYNIDQWYAVNIPDEYQTLSSDGIVVNSSGTPIARSMAGGDGITWSNADGTTGNPTPTVAYPFNQSRTITDPADADDYNWFRAPAALTLSAFNCFAEGTTPSITVDLQECDSAGANCATVLGAAVTANGGNDAGTITDTSVAAGAWMRVLLGAPSGTVDAITFSLDGTQ